MAADKLSAGFGNYPATGTAIPSADYTAADPTPAEFNALGAVGLTAVLVITAQSGAGNTLTLNIEGFDKASGTWVLLLASAAIANTPGTTVYIVDPRVVAAANVSAMKPLWERMRFRPVKAGTTTTLTYSVGFTLSM